MTDIVEKLRLMARSPTDTQGTLHREAADEIARLRDENQSLKDRLEQYYKLAEPEF